MAATGAEFCLRGILPSAFWAFDFGGGAAEAVCTAIAVFAACAVRNSTGPRHPSLQDVQCVRTAGVSLFSGALYHLLHDVHVRLVGGGFGLLFEHIGNVRRQTCIDCENLLGRHFRTRLQLRDPTVCLGLVDIYLALRSRIFDFDVSISVTVFAAMFEILKAAQMDGASNWSLYRRIIIPQLRPAFMSAFVILAHLAIKTFDLVIAMTGGGPGRATELPATFMYSYTFTRNQMGIGASSAVIMLMTIAAIMIPYLYSELREKK